MTTNEASLAASLSTRTVVPPSLKHASATPTAPNSGKPKRNRWFRRWKKRSSSSSSLVGENDCSLELDLQELASAVARRNAEGSFSGITLMPLGDIRVVGQSSQPITSGLVHYTVEGFAGQDNGDDNEDNEKELYSLKRLSTKKPSRDKQTTEQALKMVVREATILTKLGDNPNICSLKGLPSNLSTTTATSDFFLLTNGLHRDTLVERIEQWRQLGAANNTNTHVFFTALYGGNSFDNDYLEDDATAPNDDLLPLKTNIAFQISKAIKAAHDAGIILRDLTPSNIGFRQDDPQCVQLIGLGHAQDTTKSSSFRPCEDRKDTLLSLRSSKRRYLAPEVWTTGEYSYKTDVYSWSMIYYEMCLERSPYQGITAVEHQKYVCEKGERPPLARYYFPQEIDTILMRAWEQDSSKRWTIDRVCQEMQTLLMQLDTCLVFEHEEDGFLFDIYVPAIASDDDSDDAVSLLEHEGDHDDDSGDYQLLREGSVESSSWASAPPFATPIEAVLQKSDASDNHCWARCVVVSDDCGTCFTPPVPIPFAGDAVVEPAVSPRRSVTTQKLPSRTPSCATISSAPPGKTQPVRMVSSAA